MIVELPGDRTRILVVLYPAGDIEEETWHLASAYRATTAAPAQEETGAVTEFYEDDEPVADVVAAFERAPKGVTERPAEPPAEEAEDDPAASSTPPSSTP